MMILAAGCREQQEPSPIQESAVPPPFAPWSAVPPANPISATGLEPLWDPSTYDRRLQALVEGPNLVPDSDFDEVDRHWAIKFFGSVRTQAIVVDEVTLPDGQRARALRVTTDQQTEITMRRTIGVSLEEPNHGVRVAVWVKLTGPNAAAEVGVYGFEASGMPNGWLLNGGQPVEGPPWLARVSPEPGGWQRIRGYLIPPSEHARWSDPADTSGRNLQASARLAQLSLFATARAGGGLVELSVARPVIEAVRFEPLSPPEG